MGRGRVVNDCSPGQRLRDRSSRSHTEDKKQLKERIQNSIQCAMIDQEDYISLYRLVYVLTWKAILFKNRNF